MRNFSGRNAIFLNMLPRQVAHRAKREIKEVRAKDVAELRAENQRLKRDNSRLRRNLEKYGTDSWKDHENKDELVESLAEVEAKGKHRLKKNINEGLCPDCGSNSLTTFSAGPKTLTICKDCKWRKAV